jgi:hypothetical protein
MDEIRASVLLDEEQPTNNNPSSNSANPSTVATQEEAPASSTPLPLCLSQSRVQAQRTFVRSLLDHQNEHNVHGIRDPRGLYQFSRSLSKPSRLRALQDAEYMARDCSPKPQQQKGQQTPSSSSSSRPRKNNATTTKLSNADLFQIIDKVLHVLDAPLPPAPADY